MTGTSSGFGRRLTGLALARGDRVIATAHHAARVWNGIDVLVNNAGYGLPALLEEGGASLMLRQFQTNFFGVVNICNAVLPYMRKKRNGTVVVIGSRSAWKPERVRGLGFYAASKAAVHAMSESLALELEPFNIRVLLVEPGSFRTEGILDYDEQRAVGRVNFSKTAGKQPGDPDKAMEIVVDVVKGEGCAAGREWPLYLVLGKDAEADIRNKCAKVLKHLDDWNDVIRGVDVV
ncbi:uncharacterized protein BJ212DRAFT_1481373 [Suillus subaureus]|uniref:NAD(P)-binding protein n=1 Tax=Suillus subaureus TaxID=48587 RepID=A0A9P7JD20_9AGAM|nr:uncharacterized protein BJ212DRAFT_1481373 [Suillus subaureus]KAG1815602.1 hypothetical protein BJ212DRAFT_1481373 [Suillus subaureus]